MAERDDGERRSRASEDQMEKDQLSCVLLMHLPHTPGTVVPEELDRSAMVFSNKNNPNSPVFAKQHSEERAATEASDEMTFAMPRECWGTSHTTGMQGTSNTLKVDSVTTSMQGLPNFSAPTNSSLRDMADTNAPGSTSAPSRDITNMDARGCSMTAPESLNVEVQGGVKIDAVPCANYVSNGFDAEAGESSNVEALGSASTEARQSGADSSTSGSVSQAPALQPVRLVPGSGRPMAIASNRVSVTPTKDYNKKQGKMCRPSISFARNPESSLEVDVVNCEEPGPSSPTKGARPVSESILRSGTKDVSQDASGRYLVSLPPCEVVTETQYYFTVTDVAVREAARMQSKRVEIIRALTLIEPLDVNGPDKNMRRFLKLGYKRWVYDRAKTDGMLDIRQVLHFAGGCGFVVWSQQSLRVVLLDPEGPVQEWNNKQRAENLVHACIEINDLIVNVNGETKATEMIRKLESNEPLRLTIHRDPPKLPEAPTPEIEVKRSCCCVGF